MKFSDEKKRAIENYILDKIESGDPDLSANSIRSVRYKQKHSPQIY